MAFHMREEGRLEQRLNAGGDFRQEGNSRRPHTSSLRILSICTDLTMCTQSLDQYVGSILRDLDEAEDRDFARLNVRVAASATRGPYP
jgi:hypothetical protein